MTSPLGYLGQLATYLLFALFIGYFSDSPAFTSFPSDQAMLRLSFVHGGQRHCRERTPEELAALPPNMRAPLICSRERAPLLVELELDDAMLFRDLLPPGGLAGGGPSQVHEGFAVAPGRYRLTARLRDSFRSQGFDYEQSVEIDLAAREHFVVDFRAESGGFRFRPGRGVEEATR